MRWGKIGEGWYETEEGDTIQYWDNKWAAPKKKTGWYAWPCLGPFKSLKEAKKAIKIAREASDE